ncbi:MAG: M28 family peptidase [Flavipsychrobacter sp.]
MKNILAAILLPAALCTTLEVAAQKKSDKKIVKQLKQDIGYLASDELKGRRTGSAGEEAAANYIIKYYKEQGVSAYKDKYIYPFTFVNGRKVGAATTIQLGNEKVPTDIAFPLPFSANATVDAKLIPEVFEQDNVWMISLYADAEEAKNPHFDWEKAAFKKVLDAAKHGATGVLLYDKYGAKYEPQFNKKSSFENLDIPSAFLSHKGYKEYAEENEEELMLHMSIDIEKTNLTGNNIAGYVDNGATYTVVLGAHYDHLGMGEDGNSRYTGKEPQIHNGADDNASGTAALMQLASWVKNSSFKQYNYLFVHFSAEELGLIGSKAFVEDMSLDSSSIAYMINMDMVGRLNDSTHALTVGGVGTAKVWGNVIVNDNFKVSIDSSGVGPSDHSSFYHQGIPVLFFFTGTHTDYHKPEDDADKINYEGEAAIIKYVYNVVGKMEQEPKPKFSPTKQKDIGKVRFKVTLGIMPDYAFQGEGVRVDGVTEARPAQVAGVKGGDIITAIGKLEIKGMQTYMEALAEFNVGDETTVTVKREGKEMTMPLIFTPKEKKH